MGGGGTYRAAWYVLGKRVGSTWRGLVAIAVLAGLGFGGTLAVVATARRTATAHDRFFPSVHAYDHSTGYGPDLVGEPIEEVVAAVDGLEEHQQIVGFTLDVAGIDPSEVQFFFGWWRDVARLERPTVLAGRLPRPDAVHEVVLNEEAARGTGLSVGHDLTTGFQVFDFESGSFGPLPGVEQELEIVGVVRLPDEFVLDGWRQAGVLVLSPAFVDRYWDARAWGNVWMRLTPGASSAPLQAALGGTGLAFDEDRSSERQRVWQSIRPLVTVMAIIGCLGFIAVLVLAVQAVLRHAQRHAQEREVLRALGAERRERLLVEVGIAGLVAIATVCVAVAIAIGLSPLAPVGPYRDVDPGRGVFADPLVLIVGPAAILVALVAAAAVAGGTGQPRGARVGSPLPLRSLPLAIRLGVGWAFDPRRSGSRSVLGATAAIAAAVGLVVSAVVFVGSLRALSDNPPWYGGMWDLVLRAPYGEISPDAVEDAFGDDPAVEGWAQALIQGGSVDGSPVTMIGLIAGTRGRAWPLVVDGETPDQRGEILVGIDTIDALGLDIGDRVTLTAQNVESGTSPTWQADIVGTAIFPNIGYRGVDPPRLGRGIAMAGEELRERSAVFATTIALVELAPGVDPEDFAATHAQLPGGGTVTDWVTDLEPVEIREMSRTTGAIWLSVAGLGLVAAGMLAHGLAVGVNRRRRDYGVLRAIGLTTRQISSTVVVHALAAYGVALVIALAGGIALGRVMWLALAQQLDVLPRAPVGFGALAVVALTGLVCGGAVALPWAARARRISVTAALKAE